MAPKKRERSELEYYKGLVRELKAELRHLRKELGRSGKKLQHLEANAADPDPDPIENLPTKPSKERCVGCSGEVEIVDLGVKLMKICKECRSRETIKK
jgi:hypothetical protein